MNFIVVHDEMSKRTAGQEQQNGGNDNTDDKMNNKRYANGVKLKGQRKVRTLKEVKVGTDIYQKRGNRALDSQQTPNLRWSCQPRWSCP